MPEEPRNNLATQPATTLLVLQVFLGDLSPNSPTLQPQTLQSNENPATNFRILENESQWSHILLIAGFRLPGKYRCPECLCAWTHKSTRLSKLLHCSGSVPVSLLSFRYLQECHRAHSQRTAWAACQVLEAGFLVDAQAMLMGNSQKPHQVAPPKHMCLGWKGPGHLQS